MQELRALIHYFRLDQEIFFWRSTEGVEVDFIIYGPKTLMAIEVKASQKIQSSYLEGLKEFFQDYLAYQPLQLFLLYGGQRREEYPLLKSPGKKSKSPSIIAMNVIDFLKNFPNV